MKQRLKRDRPDNECPECGIELENTRSALYLCLNEAEAYQIGAILGRSIIVKIGDQKPRRLYQDGTFTPRDDIMQPRHGGDYWYSASGLRYEAVKITWGQGAAKEPAL